MKKLVFLIDRTTVPTWQKELIYRVGLLANVKTSAVVSVNNVRANHDEKKIGYRVIRFLLSLLLDYKIVIPDAFSLVALDCLVKKISTIRSIHKISEKWGECNILVNLVPWIDEQKLSRTTGLTVWGFRFGDSANINNPLTTYREILEFKSISYLRVVAARPDNENILAILYESASSTVSYSTRINANQLAWKAVECTQRLLQSNKIEEDCFQLQRANSSRTPGNLKLSDLDRKIRWNVELSSLMKWLTVRIIKGASNIFYKEQWILANAEAPLPFSIPQKLFAIMPPQDRFWADPHPFKYKGKSVVFFEDLLYADNKGLISGAILNGDGSFGEIFPVLEQDYHLSYPFVFEANNDIYMIPETAANRTIELYKCTAFPERWEYVGKLMDNVIAQDATLLYYDGFWWLFVNMSPIHGMSSSDQLHLYYSKKFPTDNWTAHPANPLIDDVRLSRSAGKIFLQDGKLFRPSQDSSGRYGRCLNVNEIVKLNQEDYREILRWKWQPNDFSNKIIAMHTFNHLNGTLLMDAQINRFRWPTAKSVKMIHL